MNVCGFDYSSKAVHLVLLDENTNNATDLDICLVGDTPFDRARQLRHKFPRPTWWEDNGVYLVGLEQPFSRGHHATKALGIMAGALAALIPAELPIVQTTAKEWKRALTGNPDASKEMVRVHAAARWIGAPVADVAQDTWDAFGVAWCVRALNEEAVRKAVA